MAKYKFRGALSDLDPADWVKSDRRLRELRDALAGRGVKNADSLVERLLIGALDDFGTHFLAKKGALVDRVIQLRRELSDTLSDVLEGGGVAKKISPADLSKKFDDLDKALADLGVPTDKLGKEKVSKKNLDAAKKDIDDALDTATGKKKPTPLRGDALDHFHARLEASNFKKVKGAWVKRYADGHIEVRVENGRFRVRSFDSNGVEIANFGEFQTMLTPYRNRPRSSRVMQAHHGSQNALMKELFGKLDYDGGDVPTIWLRDSTGDSPHGKVTHEFQNPNLAKRKQEADYGKIRGWAREELGHAGASHAEIEAYLKAIDDHMRKKVFSQPKFQNLPAAKKKLLLGDFEP